MPGRIHPLLPALVIALVALAASSCAAVARPALRVGARQLGSHGPGSGRLAAGSRVPLIALAQRAGRAWSAWRSHRYETGYVHPQRWGATLGGCLSSASAHYTWVLTPLQDTGDLRKGPPQRYEADACPRHIALAQLGRWKVELTVKHANGTQESRASVVKLSDLLVVSIGDSLSSGEGNPDIDRGAGSPARWIDRQCHRSTDAWSAHLASRLQSATRTVTYLNYACSGAEIRHLISSRYRGIVKGDPLPTQLDAVERDVGARPVDALLVSIGINDLGFSDILDFCAHHVGGCTHAAQARHVFAGLHALGKRYAALEAALSTHINAARVYLLEYPVRVLTDGGDHPTRCGAFKLNMNIGEVEWFIRRGNELNAAMQAAARANGWTYLDGVARRFRGHGYCAGARTWYRSYSGSQKLQASDEGTFHPNRAGHRAIADTVRRATATDPSPPPLTRVRIQITSVRIDDRAASIVPSEVESVARCSDCRRVRIGVLGLPDHTIAGPNGRALPVATTIAVPKGTATWIVDTTGNALQLSVFTHLPTITVANPLKPDHRTGAPRFVGGVLYLRRSDGWRTGRHVLTAGTPGQSVRIAYRVSAGPPMPQLSSPAPRRIATESE